MAHGYRGPGDRDALYDAELDELPARPARSRPSPGKVTLTSRLLPRLQAPAGPEVQLQRAAQSPGQPLPTALRSDLEGALGVELSAVRVHQGDDSAAAAKSISARAYTHGQDIHFAAGAYDSSSRRGQELIAHEVAHTVQQRQASTAAVQGKLAVSTPADASEHEADRFAAAFVRGERAPVIRGSVSGLVARQDDDAVYPDIEVIPGEGDPYLWLPRLFAHVTHGDEATQQRLRDADSQVVRQAVAAQPASQPTPQDARHIPQSDPGAAPEAPRQGQDSSRVTGPMLAADGGHAYQRPLSWDHDRARRGHAGIAPSPSGAGTLREDFEPARQQYVIELFGPNMTLERAQAGQRVAVAIGDQALADNIRGRLFRVNQYAVIDTLQVESSPRYEPDGDTYCNIYTSDVVTALGGYLPVVWWRSRALQRLLAGEQPAPEATPENVTAMNANLMCDWLNEWGRAFGWRREEDPERAQQTANAGNIVIVAGRGRHNEDGSEATGHFTVVVAESVDAAPGGDESRHAHREGGRVSHVLESNAGESNFRYGNRHDRHERGLSRRPDFWANQQRFEDQAYWVYSNAPQSPIATPEELGYQRTEPGPAATP